MNRAHVMHVVPDLQPYGLERIVATLTQLGNRDRFRFSVISLFGETEGSLAPELSADGITVYHLDKKRGLDPRMWPRLASVFRQARPDVLHTHNYVMRYTLPAAIWSGVPHQVHTIHNLAEREVDSIGRRLARWAFRGRVQPVTISEECAASYGPVYGLPDPPMIRNGITVQRYAAPEIARAEWLRKEGFAQGDLLFTCVARFDAQKNHATLIEAFAEVAAKVPNAKLVLAGTGGLKDTIEARVRELKLIDRVRFLGQRDDIPSLLGASDVFVLASLWEGNPLSVMEALAAGLPVAVSRVGAIPELAEDGLHGRIVTPGKAEELAAAMIEFAANPGFRIEAGRAAARRAAERFDHQHMVDAYEALYELYLDRKRMADSASARTVSA